MAGQERDRAPNISGDMALAAAMYQAGTGQLLGRDFYVNDGSRTGDGFTTAVGDNLNSGKSPDKPMKSLRGLLAAHNLDAGDVIHVDAGTYRLVRNIELSSDDSGVVLEGWVDPVDGSRDTVLNRGNTNSTAVFEFTGGDDITIRGFGITGAQHGVLLAPSADSDRVTVTGNGQTQSVNLQVCRM
jgi:hypothetical protein